MMVIRTGARPWRTLLGSILLAALLAGPAAGAPVQAKSGGGKTRSPLVIEADRGIEWVRDKHQYVARGNAKATRDDITVEAETLTAHYKISAKGKNEIWRVNADSNVRITSQSRTLYGDNGVYNVETGLFVLTGRALRMVAPGEIITARDKIEYYRLEQIVVVTGNAVAVRGDKRIRADKFIAHLKEDAQGKTSIQWVDAVGNVVITSPQEVARGEKGVYNPQTGMATLTGSVKLTRGDTQLNGEYAEINLNTGQSRLLADPQGVRTGKRVRGLFLPRETKRRAQ